MSPREEEKSFQLRVHNLPEDERERYERLLHHYRVEQAKKNNGKPVGRVPLEQREEILLSAKATRTFEEAVQALSMKLAFNNATSKEGRPPIGGAPND